MRHCRRGETAIAILAVVLATAAAWAAESPTAASPVYEMEVMGVQADPQSGAPMVFLRGKQDKRELAMFIGPFEAQAIALPLQGIRPPRPYTHDLMLEALHRLQAKVKRVVITALRDNTYFAQVVLDVQGQELLLDSRPSDAVALALREGAPILAAEAAFARSPRPAAPAPDERKTP
jgi:bifunctional DNase/RNase